MRKSFLLFIVLCSSFIMTACNTTPKKENAGAGMAVGAAVGAATGNPAIMAASAALGATIGYSMNTDGKPVVVSVKKAEVKPVAVKKPKTLVATVKKPKPAVLAEKPIIKRTILKSSKVISYQGNVYCKEYSGTKTLGGKTENITGIACKQPSGKWRTMT